MKTWCALIAAFAVGALAYSVVREAGAAGARSFAGSVDVGRIEHLFEMAGGFTARGTLGDARRYADTRQHRFVPSHYGQLFSITGHGEDAVLWFRDAAGVVRNVTVFTATRQMVHVETQTSKIRQVRR